MNPVVDLIYAPLSFFDGLTIYQYGGLRNATVVIPTTPIADGGDTNKQTDIQFSFSDNFFAELVTKGQSLR